MDKKNFYITTTLPYVNADLHMGHALEFVRADIIARYKKAAGFDVYFNTGTDEHGMKIYEKALSVGKNPQDFVDESFLKFKEAVKIFGMDKDTLHFVRTTDIHHIQAAQEFWRKVYNNGFIDKRNYEAKYCVGCEETKQDSDLINGECPIHPGRPLEIIKEENYFFKYSEFGDKLLRLYKENPDFVVPDFRFNEIKAFVERDLQDFSISRLKSKMPWGIPVPGDEKHVMYVWFDALTNYISTLGWPENKENFVKYWKNGNPTQYCGKDNLRFQAAMWQAMLMAADLPNSHQIVIDGFITAEHGLKMSKTLGNVISPAEIVAEYGTDALRFFLAKEISNFEDSPFTTERFKDSYNANLANGLGNLVSRIMTLSERIIDKRVAELLAQDAPKKGLLKFITDDLDKFDINSVCQTIWIHISKLDKQISEEEVFKIVKIDLGKAKQMLTDYIGKLSDIAFELEIVLPETSKKIFEIIKANKKPEKPLFLRKE